VKERKGRRTLVKAVHMVIVQDYGEGEVVQETTHVKSRPVAGPQALFSEKKRKKKKGRKKEWKREGSGRSAPSHSRPLEEGEKGGRG